MEKLQSKIKWNDDQIKKYIKGKRFLWKSEERLYLDNAYRYYNKVDNWLDKYPFLRKVDLSKYRLPESARHSSLNNIRYPK